MTTNAKVLEYPDSIAPVSTKMDFDNVRLLAGHADAAGRKIVVSLDITMNVIDEAIKEGADLIVSHHPLFFGIKNANDTTPDGARL